MTDLDRMTNQRDYNRRLADHQKTVIDRLNAEITKLQDELREARAPTPQKAAKVSAECRENIVDEIESIICEAHDMDVRDIDYAENIVSWLERHHPAALRAISEKTQ